MGLTVFGDDKETQKLKPWIEPASNGDPEALQYLENRASAKRDPRTWLAIASGRAHAKRWPESVAAYREALQLDPNLQPTERDLCILYQAMSDTEASAAALEVAALCPGTVGADLIFAVLEATGSERHSKLDRRLAKTLLDAARSKGRVSAALRVAIRLDAARSCGEYKSLIPEALVEGDQRSSRFLRKLTYERGCGLLGLMDCYPCLRGGRALAQVIEATKARPSPDFRTFQLDIANAAPPSH